MMPRHDETGAFVGHQLADRFFFRLCVVHLASSAVAQSGKFVQADVKDICLAFGPWPLPNALSPLPAHQPFRTGLVSLRFAVAVENNATGRSSPFKKMPNRNEQRKSCTIQTATTNSTTAITDLQRASCIRCHHSHLQPAELSAGNDAPM